jgi:hypothetical protein
MMFVRIISIADNGTSDRFRDWGKKLSDAMEAVGFIKTADTGQIDWSTVLMPDAARTYMGYEIRRFTDALQDSSPVFVKIEYGSCAYNKVKPGMRITVGQGSDGEGNLTGFVSSYFYINCYGSADTSEYSSHISGDGGRINLGTWLAASSNSSGAFWIERMKDSSGNPTADGVHICSSVNNDNHGTTSAAQFLPVAAEPYPLSPGKFMCAIPSTSNMTTYSENIGIFPVYVNLGCAGNPDLGGLVISLDELQSSGAMMTINILGSNHNYIIIRGLSFAAAGNSSCNVLLRCE